ncbi:MAG: xylose isomerase [Planctomycetota bacterium]
MTKHYFPEIPDRVPFEGPASKNPLAYRYFDVERKVGGKSMAAHLPFAIAYWHSMRGTGADPFGGKTLERPWGQERDPLTAAESTLDALFELVTKLGIRHYCFHDRDLAPEGANIAESNRALEHMVARAAERQRATGVRLLWGTANLFSHPRYTHGAATNPDPMVFAHAAAQVRRAIDATLALDGAGYVFWGGREGYSSWLNTDMKREREQLARFLALAVDYGRRAGFKGKFFIEPKPMEPAAHQYDFDAATTLGFLREFNLLDHFELNIEANHATLAQHSFQHELLVASHAGKLGSIDINRGDLLLGWDTDQFPNDLYGATAAMLVILQQGGLPHGGLNFDAKVRRGSFDTIDLFHAHIGGIDTFARALLIAQRIIDDRALSANLAARYAGYQTGVGAQIVAGTTTLEALEALAMQFGEPTRQSGREEALENILQRYLYDPSIV